MRGASARIKCRSWEGSNSHCEEWEASGLTTRPRGLDDGGFIPESTSSVQTAAILRTLLESSLGRDCSVGAQNWRMS